MSAPVDILNLRSEWDAEEKKGFTKESLKDFLGKLTALHQKIRNGTVNYHRDMVDLTRDFQREYSKIFSQATFTINNELEKILLESAKNKLYVEDKNVAHWKIKTINSRLSLKL
jgi:hypothetical protein